MQFPNIAATVSYVIPEHVHVTTYLHTGLRQKSVVSGTLSHIYKSFTLNYQIFNVIILCPLLTYNNITGFQNRDSAGILCPTLQDQSANLQPSISAPHSAHTLQPSISALRSEECCSPEADLAKKKKNLQPVLKRLQESACHAHSKNLLCMDQSLNP